MYKVTKLFKSESPYCPTLARLYCLNRTHVSFKVWLFWRSPGKPYRWLPLDNRCANTRAELSGVTHGWTKTRLSS
ncbi:hypothetical protein Hanom_Chr16g01519741 [Helianthus anomalus]